MSYELNMRDGKAEMYGTGPEPVLVGLDVAVVGSSDTILGQGQGELIDQHEEVIRFNFAKTKGYEKDLGKRETIRFWMITEKCLKRLYGNNKKLRDRDIMETTAAPIIISWLHFCKIKEQGEYYGRSTAFFLDGNIVGRMTEELDLTLTGNPRSGMMMLSSLVLSGIRPHVYGFGTQSRGTTRRANYHDGKNIPLVGYHNVPEEEVIVKKLAQIGLITLHDC